LTPSSFQSTVLGECIMLAAIEKGDAEELAKLMTGSWFRREHGSG